MSTPLPPQSRGTDADEHGTATPENSAHGVPGQASEVDPLTVFDPAKMLPIGRLGMARQATHGPLAMQLRDIERQAGVRRTL
jgi:hypothetical protein